MLAKIKENSLKKFSLIKRNQSLCRTKNISALNSSYFFLNLIRLESVPIDLARAIC